MFHHITRTLHRIKRSHKEHQCEDCKVILPKGSAYLSMKAMTQSGMFYGKALCYACSAGKFQETPQNTNMESFLALQAHSKEVEAHFFQVEKPFCVYKRTIQNSYKVLVNLVIPVGALIHFDTAYTKGYQRHTRKMRTDRALVHSQWTIRAYEMDHYKKLKDRIGILGGYDLNFSESVFTNRERQKLEYITNDEIFINDFYRGNKQCAEGIHFFTSAADAANF